MDEATATVLAAWRKERLAWGLAWTDTGRVFTKEDGTPVRRGWISQRFGDLAERGSAPPRPRRRPGEAEQPRRDGLPPIRFHDFRHGTATMLLAAGQPPKVISEVLGHATVAFTMDVYTEVAEELADAAMERSLPTSRARTGRPISR